MDSAGDAEGNFTVIGLVVDDTVPGGWRAEPVATFRYTNSSDPLPELVGGNMIAWIGGKPPLAEPPCGFNGYKCSLPHDPGVLSAVAAVVAAALLAMALLVRHYRYEQKLASVLWRIEAKDLTFISTCNTDKVTFTPQICTCLIDNFKKDEDPEDLPTPSVFHKPLIVRMLHRLRKYI